jgi:hypothetical protein
MELATPAYDVTMTSEYLSGDLTKTKQQQTFFAGIALVVVTALAANEAATNPLE